ncbi:hypothetical protein [Kitasatospora griseola]|uniref:hypothetical protein n=1 Tax=Kitasatospora griseola TaxID=2064 RepID=UPI0037FE06C7
MSHVGAEAELVRLSALQRLGDGQQVLLGGILRALDPRGLLTQHAASGGTAAAALSRALAVLQSRGTPGDGGEAQPHEGPAFRIQKHAERAVGRACGFAATDARLVGAGTFLRRIVADGPDKLTPRRCLVLAKEMDRHRKAVEEAIIEFASQAWTSPASNECLAWIAAELAALCLTRERDYDLLLTDLHNALRQHSPLSGQALVETALPVRRPFRVVVAVEGAATLTSLGTLMPGDADCSQFPADSLPEKWAYGRSELAALADLVKERTTRRSQWGGSSPRATLLAFRVRACDHGAAMLSGRREAAQLLDQYVAGQRLAELRLGEETLVCAETFGSTRRFSGTLSTSDAAEPLAEHWPPALREGMRMAHIARSTQGLTASTGLCWAALEALGLKNVRLDLAKALSLQVLRQQVTSAYQELRVATLGRCTAAAAAFEAAERQRAALSRQADKAAAEGRAVASALQARLDAARVTVEARAKECEAAEVSYREPLKVLDRWTAATDRGRISDINRWLDVLTPPADGTEELLEAAAALRGLTRGVGGWAAHAVRSWQQRLADPAATTEWLKDMECRFEAALEWLYATRNTALHEGRFESATGTLDAQGGRALVDLTLEFLGNWYRHAPAGTPAYKVVRELGKRQTTIVKRLEAKGVHSLNLTYLTSPTSTGLDRP